MIEQLKRSVRRTTLQNLRMARKPNMSDCIYENSNAYSNPFESIQIHNAYVCCLYHVSTTSIKCLLDHCIHCWRWLSETIQHLAEHTYTIINGYIMCAYCSPNESSHCVRKTHPLIYHQAQTLFIRTCMTAAANVSCILLQQYLAS